MRPYSGTYIVILKIGTSQDIEVGRIGSHSFKKGYYFYVGSAHGPGGLKARLTRHVKKGKSKHWHIDYIRDAGSIISILVQYSKEKKECSWAEKLNSSGLFAIPIYRFGSSDCSCESHLYYSKKRLTLKILQNIISEPFENIRI